MSGTSLDVAVSALVAGFTGLGVAGLSVTDGPNWDPANVCLEVAWSPMSGAEPVTVSRALNNAAASMHQESVQVDCLLSVHDGSETVAQARAALIGVFAQLEGWVTSSPSLGGAVALAQIVSLGYLPGRDEGGVLTSLRFTVAVTAFV